MSGRSDEDDWAVVTLAGEIDLVSAAPYEEAVFRLCAEGQRRIRFDVAAVEFMGSVGLRIVAIAHSLVKAEGGQVEVVGASSMLQRVFEASGLGFLLASA